eukprot:5128950-Prymnesium_polylepis.3
MAKAWSDSATGADDGAAPLAAAVARSAVLDLVGSCCRFHSTASTSPSPMERRKPLSALILRKSREAISSCGARSSNTNERSASSGGGSTPRAT